MTAEQFLDHQETRTLRALRRATVQAGQDLRASVDVVGFIERHPLLLLGGGVVAGFVVGKLITVGGRVAMRRTLGAVVRPLIRPTLSGLGTAIAALVIGSPLHDSGD